MKVAITGATGFIGSRLVERLTDEKHAIVAFSRNPEKARRRFPTTAFPQVEIVGCDLTQPGAWQQAISGCDGVVNLAGEPLAEGRWTPDVKQKILNSRQLCTRQVVDAIAQAESKPSVLVSASAIGYYGTSETASFEESSAPGKDFLAEVCQAWEQEAQRVQESGTRLAILRIGIVVGPGGAIAKMVLPFKLFAGGPIGSGQQWFSWIHREDLVNLILRSLTDASMAGTYNATAPNPVRMNELCNTLGSVLGRPSWLPVPGFALETLLGEGAQVVLNGQQVLPKQTQASGFDYQYPTLKPALQQAVKGM